MIRHTAKFANKMLVRNKWKTDLDVTSYFKNMYHESVSDFMSEIYRNSRNDGKSIQESVSLAYAAHWEKANMPKFVREAIDPREDLAEYAHNAWAGWMKYLFDKSIHHEGCRYCECDKGEKIIPKWAVERWTRQMNTAYADLPEEEKENDREEADKMIAIMEGGD